MSDEAKITSQDVAQAALEEIKRVCTPGPPAAVKASVLVALLEHPTSLDVLNRIAQGKGNYG